MNNKFQRSEPNLPPVAPLGEEMTEQHLRKYVQKWYPTNND